MKYIIALLFILFACSQANNEKSDWIDIGNWSVTKKFVVDGTTCIALGGSVGPAALSCDWSK